MYLNEATLLHNLKLRYKKDIIYVSITAKYRRAKLFIGGIQWCEKFSETFETYFCPIFAKISLV